MTHILCPELAPLPVTTLLDDWNSSRAEFSLFIEAVTADVDAADFGTSLPEQTASVCSCEAITILVQCRTVDSSVRQQFLQEERPQDDFEPEDFETWSGVLLALQFAGDELIERILKEIPIEFIAAAIMVLPEENQARARAIFYQ